MDLMFEALRRLDRGQPFRVAVPLVSVTDFLSRLVALRGDLPTICIQTARAGLEDALIDFAGATGSWLVGKRSTDSADARDESRDAENVKEVAHNQVIRGIAARGQPSWS